MKNTPSSLAAFIVSVATVVISLLVAALVTIVNFFIGSQAIADQVVDPGPAVPAVESQS